MSNSMERVLRYPVIDFSLYTLDEQPAEEI